MFKDVYLEAYHFLDGFGFWMIHVHEVGYYPRWLNNAFRSHQTRTSYSFLSAG